MTMARFSSSIYYFPEVFSAAVKLHNDNRKTSLGLLNYCLSCIGFECTFSYKHFIYPLG